MVFNISKLQVFEYSDSIGKFLPDKDRPDEGVFSFKDENKWLVFEI
jgi:histidyl-tRNA synthetase